jgi:hypothetical protein
MPSARADRGAGDRLGTDAGPRCCRLIAPIFRIWRISPITGDQRVDSDGAGDRLLVRRDPDGIGVERLAAGEFAWLVALAEGAPLGASIDLARGAEAAFDLARALRAHIGAATIVSIGAAG